MRLAKIVVPRVPRRFVDRPELRDHLDAQLEPADAGRVVLVSAPAGHGKTAAVADWVRRTPDLATAWLSLDASDRDETQWWSSVLAALASTSAVPAESPLRTRHPAWSSGPSAERTAFLGDVLNALDEVPVPLRLVIDDVHEIVGHPALDGLRELLRHPLSRLSIVLCSRYDPPVGLHRLRLDGRLGELRGADLTFTTSAAVTLFHQEALRLSHDEVATLVDRTEGWVAALRLTALSLRGNPEPARFVREFAGDDRSVADYLFGEVWEVLGEHDRTVLEVASVSSPLPVGLAVTLVGRDDTAETLERLDAVHGLVTATDRRRELFRTHELVRSHVLARLRRHHPDRLAELYRRAATWYDEHGEPRAALRCAAEAGDVETTRTLLRARAVELMGRGEFAVLERSEELSGAAGDPRVRLLLGLAALERGRIDRAEEFIASAEHELAGDRSTNTAVVRRVAALRLAVSRGRIPDAVALADTIHPEIVEGRPLTALALVARASALAVSRPEQARADCERVLTLTSEEEWPYLEMQARTTLAISRLHSGRRPRATAFARAAVEQAADHGWGHSPWVVRARATLATADVLRGDPEAARAVLATVDLEHLAGHPQMVAVVEVVRGIVECDSGNPVQGWRRLQRARTSTPAEQFPHQQLAIALVVEQEIALRLGWAREAGDATAAAADRLAGHAETHLVRARREWATSGDATAVRTVLAPLLGKEVPARTPLGIIGPVLLDAEIAVARGERSTAHHRIERALRLSTHFDVLRPVLRAEPGLRRYLAAQRGSFGEHDTLVDRVLTSVAAEDLEVTRGLTARERAVLARLPTMRSTTEIADDLSVSVNTVKSHQRAIYQKLGVDSRRAAVTRARHVGLLTVPVSPAPDEDRGEPRPGR